MKVEVVGRFFVKVLILLYIYIYIYIYTLSTANPRFKMFKDGFVCWRLGTSRNVPFCPDNVNVVKVIF